MLFCSSIQNILYMRNFCHNHFVPQSDKVASQKHLPAHGSVAPLCCPGEGDKVAGYKLCVHTADARQVRGRKNEAQV